MSQDLSNIGNKSRIIVALDFHPPGRDPLEWWIHVLEEISDIIAGVKIGLPALLKTGLKGISKLVQRFEDEVYFLADFKLADIPAVVLEEIEQLSALGFKGSIIHLFPMGYEPVVDKARKLEHQIFGVVYMSHRGCKLFNELFQTLLEYALTLHVDGVIVGATEQDKIRSVRAKLGKKMLILSPGVGAQGASPGSALRAGADFEIVGRAITMSRKPRQAAISITRAQVMKYECGGRA